MIKLLARTLFPLLLLLAAVNLLNGCRNKGDLVIQSSKDVAKARIGVMTGSTGEALAKARFPQASIQTFDDIMNAVAALQAKKLDAVLTAFPTAQQVVKKNPALFVVPENLDQEDTSIAVRKGDAAMLNDLNRIIAAFKADGTLDAMKKRWLKADLSPYEVPDLPVPTKGKPIIVGVSATREPMSFVDAAGNVSGHDGELARRIAIKLNRPIQFQDMKFLALIPALKSGKIDMVITGMTATGERRKSVDFSDPYFFNSQVLMALKPASAGPAAAASPSAFGDAQAMLAKGKIAVLTGSAGDLAARKHFPQATFFDMTTSADAALAVRSHKVDAFVYDKSVLLNLVEKDPGLVILPQPVDKLGIAAAFNKNNAELLAQFNQQLAALQADGTLKALRAKWIDSKYKTTPATPAAASQGAVLRMGTCADIEPFSFHSNGGLAGLDVELGRLLAQRLGRRLEILDMSFEGLIPALQSGKIDFALSNFNVTDERKKLINFSTPYVENDISALVAASAVSSAVAASPAAAGGKLASAAGLKDKRIGTLLGTAHSTYVAEHYPQAKLQEFKTAADVILAVKTRKVDAALYDAESLRPVLKQDASLGILDPKLFSFHVGVGFNKRQTALREQFNRFLAESKKNGVYDGMVKRWMEQGETTMPRLDLPKSGAPINVAVNDAGLPFVAVQDNQLAGFDIELITRFAQSVGRPVHFDNMDFGSIIASVSSGKSDALISGVYITPERQKQVDFSEPYFTMATQVFALNENLANPAAASSASAASSAPVSGRIRTLDDLKNRRLGVLLGSVHDGYAQRTFPQATVMQFKSPPDLILAVRTGKIDASFYTHEILEGILRQEPELATFGGNVLSNPIATGYRKGNNELREQFNAFLAKIKKDGTYDSMVQRWMKSHDYTMPKIGNPGSKGKIVVGYVSDKGMPFTEIRDNQPIGFDMELIQRFGAYMGKKVELTDMEFGSLIAAVSTGKIDMIVSTLMITPERQKQIDFSDPYYELGTDAFALKSNLAGYEGAQTEAPAKPSFLDGVVSSFRSNILLEKRYLLILDGLETTILISILSAIFGTLLGALVCFMRMSRLAALNLPAKAFIGVLRGTPVLVLLMVIFYVVFASVSISPVLVSVVAFGMNFAAYAAEIFRSGIQSIDCGQTEAGIAMGFSPVQTFLHIILPQTVQRILPVYKGEFISLVKMTSIVGYIAVQDLTKASDIIRSRTFDAFFPLIIVAILYFLIAWVLTQILERLEQTSNTRNRRKKGA